MARIKSSSRKIDTVFIVALFTVFAATTLLVVLIAAKQYKLTAGVMEKNYEVRTASSYLREVVHQHDSADSVAVTDFEGSTALAFFYTVNDADYVTYVYCYDGSLRELTAGVDSVVTPESGQSIIEARSMIPEFADDNLLHITYTDKNGNESELYIALHSASSGKEGS